MSDETKSGVLVGGLIQNMIRSYLLQPGRREEFVAAACAIDRAYLTSSGVDFADADDGGSLSVNDPPVTAMITAIANAFIDEGLRRLESVRGAPGVTMPSIKQVVYEFLRDNGDDLIEIGVGLDRTYLRPWIGEVFGDENIPDIVRAIAEAFIDKGLEQTS